VLKRVRESCERIGTCDHFVELQTSLLIERKQHWKVDKRAALAIERIDVMFVPLEELHVDGGELFDAADSHGHAAITDHGQRRCSQCRDSGAFKGIVSATDSELADFGSDLEQSCIVACSEDGVCRTELHGQIETLSVELDSDDLARTGVHRALNDAQTNAAATKHDD
jgi:hypothetical protein